MIKDFPQIYRRITATLKQQAYRLLRLLTLSLFILITFLNFQTQLFPENEEYVKLKLLTLEDPSNYTAFLNLGFYLDKHGLKYEAYRLFQIAQMLFSKKDVLGATSPLTVYQKLSQKEELIKKELAYWKKVVKEKPDFRDAYLQLGAAYYKLGSFKESQENFLKAFQIDPLYPKMEKFQIMPYFEAVSGG